MKIFLIAIVIIISGLRFTCSADTIPRVQIMTLGVFHFDYPNLDVHKTEARDQISVLEDPFQTQILSICKAIETFQPTIIAVELLPSKQKVIDSLYSLYVRENWDLLRNEVYQLGFRIAKYRGLKKVYCVDDPGRHYNNLDSIFNDSLRLKKFEAYYLSNPDSIYALTYPNKKVSNIIDALIESNNPERVRERLSTYLLHPFKYEEHSGDFTGVDFETGRWYNRNLRIFRNVQRIEYKTSDRILLIAGSEHLNLLNLFFDISREFELISPQPYLMMAKEM
jgi:hypothetical protein